MKTLVKIKNLTLHFATFEGIVKALDGVDLDIYEGESLGLVGETGCGKTVTSRTIIRLLAPNALLRKGEIYFNDKNVLELTEEELTKIRGKEIATIFQEPLRALNPTKKIKDQIFEVLLIHQKFQLIQSAIEKIDDDIQVNSTFRLRLYGKLLKIEMENPKSFLLKIASRLPFFRGYKLYLKNDEQVIELLKKVDIANPSAVANQYPHELSGGMRQRAMIAMALACTPKLLIADEPTTAVDVTIQAKVLKLINELKDKFKTSLLLITHNLGIVAEICDRVAVMYAGTVVEICDLYTLFEKPLHPYTVGLLNAVPIIGKKRELKGIGGAVPNLLEPPSGCRFHPRCPFAMEVCRTTRPELIEIESDHKVACHKVASSLM